MDEYQANAIIDLLERILREMKEQNRLLDSVDTHVSFIEANTG